MSIALRHSPADIVRWLLIALGEGTDPDTSTVWPVYASSEPSSPDDCITVTDTAPQNDARSMIDGERFQHYGFQVRIRSREHPDGYVKAEAIFVALNEGVRMAPVIVEGTTYVVQSVSGTNLLELGKNVPASKRSLFTVNGLVTLSLVALGAVSIPVQPTSAYGATVILRGSDAVVRQVYMGPSQFMPTSYSWDGRMPDGTPAPVKQYELVTYGWSKSGSRLHGAFGSDSNPSYKKAVGNHNSVQAVVAVGSDTVLIAGAMEIAAGAARIDNAGVTKWLSFQGWGTADLVGSFDGMAGHSACLFNHSIHGPSIAVLGNNTTYGALEAATGNMFSSQFPSPNLYPGAPRQGVNSDIQDLCGRPDVTDFVAASYADLGLIYWYRVTGDPIVYQAFGGGDALGIAMLNTAKDVLCVNAGAVYRVNYADGAASVYISSAALTNPFRIAIDPVTGVIYVAERGPSHQVKRFSADGTTLQATFGVHGGRVDGAYDRTSFSNIMDIEAIPGGGFIVTEKDRPPREARWYDVNGNFLRGYQGGQQFGGGCSPEPDDLTRLWGCNNPGFTVYVGGVPVETYFQNLAIGDARFVRVLKRDGHTYLALRENGGGNVGMWLRTGSTLRKILYFSFLDPPYINMHIDTGLDGTFATTLTWDDVHDGYFGNATWEDDLSFSVTDQYTPFRLQCTGTLSNGVPVWDVAGRTTYPSVDVDGHTYRQYISAAKSGADTYLLLQNPQGGSYTRIGSGAAFGIYYQGSLCELAGLVKVTGGQVVWAIMLHDASWNTPMGGLTYPFCIAGVANGIVFVLHYADKEFAKCSMYTTDGVYVGEGIGINATDGLPHDAHLLQPGTDNFTGHIVALDAVTVRLYCQGFYNFPVYDITLPTVTSASTTYVVSSRAPPLLRGTGLTVTYYDGVDESAPVLFTRVDPPSVVSPQTRVWPIAGLNPSGATFSVRMQGSYIPDTADAMRFALYPAAEQGSSVTSKLIVAGQVVIDTVNGIGAYNTNYLGVFGRSAPVKLDANLPVVIDAVIRNIPKAVPVGTNMDLLMLGIGRASYPGREPTLLRAADCLPVVPSIASTVTADAWQAKPTRAIGELAVDFGNGSGMQACNASFAPDGCTMSGAFNAPAYIRAPVGDILCAPTDDREGPRALEFTFTTSSYDGRLAAFTRYSSFFHNEDDGMIAVDPTGIALSEYTDTLQLTYHAAGNFLDGQPHRVVYSRGPGGVQLLVDGFAYIVKPWKNPPANSPVNHVAIGPMELPYTVKVTDIRVYSGERAPAPTLRDPLQILGSSLVQWFRGDSLYQDAAGTVPATLANSPIGRAADRGVHGNHGTQATSGKRPLLAFALDGKPGIKFDGAGSYLNIPPLTVGTAFIVVNFTKATTFNSDKLYTLSSTQDLSQAPYHGDSVPGLYYLFHGFGTNPPGWQIRNNVPPFVGANNAAFGPTILINGKDRSTGFIDAWPDWPEVIHPDLTQFNLSQGTIPDPHTPLAFDGAGYFGGDPTDPGHDWGGIVMESVIPDRKLTLLETLEIQNYFASRYPSLP